MEGGATAIVLAAGAGTRIGAGPPKAFREVGGEVILVRAVRAAAAAPSIESIVVTVPAGLEGEAEELLDGTDVPVTVVAGGATRQASVRAALGRVPATVRIVAVHDAARCFVSPALFDRVVAAVAEGADGAVPVVAVTDTVKRVEGTRVLGTVDRRDLRFVQTPQAFRREILVAAHDRAAGDGIDDATDDASLVEAVAEVRIVDGDPANAKITTASDLDPEVIPGA